MESLVRYVLRLVLAIELTIYLDLTVTLATGEVWDFVVKYYLQRLEKAGWGEMGWRSSGLAR